MQSARCYAANAIHAASALHLTCGRATGPHVRRSTINATRWPGSSRKCRQLQRSYTTSTKGEIRRARRLALYEDVLIQDEPTQLSEDQRRQQRREAARNTYAHEEGPLDWKKHSLAMSEQIRNARKAHFDPPPQDADEWMPPEPQISLEYTGLAIEPQISNKHPPMPVPWAQCYEVRKQKITAAQVLDLEIAAFADYMSPTAAEQKARLHVRNSANKILATLPDHQPYTFGSFKTGLTMPYSDIDLGIFDAKLGQHALQPAMEHLYSVLANGEDFMCVVYRPAQRSIITAQHKATGIDIQLVARASGSQDTRVQDYVERVPHIKQLYGVVRTAFGVRGFVDPFIGGISAYGTFMMLAAALTRRGTPSDIHESPSSQLLHFLSFWARFDTTKYGIAPSAPRSIKDDGNGLVYPRPAKLFRKVALDDDLSPEKHKARLDALIRAARQRKAFMRAGQYRIGRSRPQQPYLLCMQDPANPTNDLGATCHAIKHILQTIKVLHRDLVHSMEEHDRSPPGDRSRGETSFLLPLVGRSHELYAERRQRLREWRPSVPLRHHQVGSDADAKRRAKRRHRKEPSRLAKGNGI